MRSDEKKSSDPLLNDLPKRELESSSGSSRRVLLLAEMFCKYVSAITLVLLGVRTALSLGGLSLPIWCDFILAVLVSGAIGYFTNYIAIEMIFKPYEKSPTHFFSIITLGFWQQGLVPRNKELIAVELGREIETKLLNPEKMAAELCETAIGILQNKTITDRLVEEAHQVYLENEEDILDFLYPWLETALADLLDKSLTSENVEIFFNEKIDPWLRREDTRQFFADMMIRFVQNRSEQILDILKTQLRDLIRGFLAKKALTSLVADSLAEGIVNSIPWSDLEWKLFDKMRDKKTAEFIRAELLQAVSLLRDRLAAPQGRMELNRFLIGFKIDLKKMLGNWLRDSLPDILRSMAESPELKIQIGEKAVPAIQPRLENWLHENGKEFIIDRLNIAGRVREAVDRQDIHQFHDMIQSLAAQHLNAIQILGYLLGAIIGAVQALQILL